MPDDPGIGEVMRRLEDIRADLKEDIREQGNALASKVSAERYLIENQALTERVKGLEEAAKEKERQRLHDRRLIFSALIAPVLMILLTVYLGAKGAAT